MTLDFIYVILLVWYLLKGYRKGIVKALVSFVAVFIGMLAALKFSHLVAEKLFSQQSSISPFIPLISYIIVFTAVVMVLHWIAGMMDKTLRTIKLGWANRIGGALLYGIIVTFAWSSVLWLANKVQLIKPETKESSVTYSYVEPFAPAGFAVIGAAIPLVKSAFSDLDKLFDKIHTKASS